VEDTDPFAQGVLTPRLDLALDGVLCIPKTHSDLKRIAKGVILLQCAPCQHATPYGLRRATSQHFSFLFWRRSLYRRHTGINHFETWCRPWRITIYIW